MGAITWALAVVVIAVVFMLVFRRDISALLRRVREISRDGIRTSAEEPQKAPPSKQATVEELMKAFDSVALLQREDAIRKDLETKGVAEGPDMIKVLIRHLAATQLSLTFEQINSIIWGSQIRILESLNSTPQGAPPESLRAFYDLAAATYQDAFRNYPFERYLGFLLSRGLLMEKDGRFLITQLGVEFLSYLIATRRTGFRHL